MTRRGVFEQAHGGTLFIDEIGDLDPSLQPKLLRALERSAVRRVGSERWIQSDLRVLCATRRDLDREVQDGRFRDDLFYRLVVGRVELPPLRRRRGDVAVLAQHFWQALGQVGAASRTSCADGSSGTSGRGTSASLKNTVARHVALGDALRTRGAAGEPAAPGDALATPPASGSVIDEILARNLPFPEARQLAKDAFERRYLERVLCEHGGSTSSGPRRASGIARRYFNLILARQRREE